jgi:hypothetical protein
MQCMSQCTSVTHISYNWNSCTVISMGDWETLWHAFYREPTLQLVCVTKNCRDMRCIGNLQCNYYMWLRDTEVCIASKICIAINSLTKVHQDIHHIGNFNCYFKKCQWSCRCIVINNLTEVHEDIHCIGNLNCYFQKCQWSCHCIENLHCN